MLGNTSSTLPRRVALLALLSAVGASCATPPASQPTPRSEPPAGPSERGPDEAWFTTVHTRIADGARAFRSDDGGFLATVSERELTGSFDAAGASLLHASDGLAAAAIGVRTVAVGRPDEARALGPTTPALGACVPGRVDPEGRCVRQLEYAHDRALEWWAAQPDGLQQGWTVEEAPGGEGPLTVDVAVEGARVGVEAGRVRLTGADTALVVSALAAWDADGVPLDAWFEATPDGFRVVVADEGGRYPVEIDPVYTTVGWEVAGARGYMNFGAELAPAGDVNADGYADVLVGSEGGAYVFLGSSSGLRSEPHATLTGGTSFGAAVAGAGDVNGDGYDDIVVGDLSDGSSTGAAYVYLGYAGGISPTPSTTLRGAVASGRFGAAVDGAGDVNGDGYADIVVGADNAGKAYVYLGSASGVSASVATTMSGAYSFGGAVVGAGDINGDGFDDVAVAEASYDTRTWATNHGRLSVFHGSAAGLSSSATTTIIGTVEGGYFTDALAAAGDVDGDGYTDLIVGMPNDYYEDGYAYLYHGTSAGLSTTPATTFADGSGTDQYGSAVAGVGDVNDDGYDDVVVGGALYTANGRARLYLGSIAGVSATAAVSFTGEAAGGFGDSVSAAGDVNGDGVDDLLVGAYAIASWAGRAYLYEGSTSGPDTTVDTYLDGTYELGFGRAVSDAGDVNADGYADVIVGAPGYHAGTGAAFVYTGSDTGLSTTAAATLTGASVGDAFGRSVSSAGDVNADGYDDVIVGADGYSSSTGRAYVHHGSTSGVARTASTTLTGAGTSYYFGYAASGAGDVNGDGYDDVVVGAYGYSSSKGRAYVYRGSATGVSTTISTTLTGGASSDNFGRAVAAAGDVNGDGYGDIVVGARGYSSNTGAAYVYVGSSSGTSSSATTLTGYSASNYFGGAVDGAGDVNGDGYDDVIVGAYGYTSSTGRAYVYHGAATGLGTSPRSVLTGAAVSNYLGASVAGAGDVDGDGYDDVIVGAYGYSSSLGRASVYPGSATGVSSTASSTLTGDVSAGEFGYAVSGAGDVDGDGYPDVIAGSGDGSGRVSVFYGYADADGDGVGVADDCDDTDATVSLPYTVYADTDGDGYGDPSTTTTTCTPTSGYVLDATDCDDDDDAIHPGSTEQCDAADLDEDCDGLTDDADPTATGHTAVYADADGDGYGAGAASFCDVPAGYVAVAGDCDDADATVSPAATEVCDAAATDEDCDGLADDADTSATGRSPYAPDADGDGHGAAITTPFCTPPSGYVASTDDCDDGSAAIHPGAAELCDAADTDEDCDGLSDDADASATGYGTWHPDADGDGYGSPTGAAYCDPPSGHVADGSDCDDTNAAVSPSAIEVCDAADTDEDCDALVDDADASATGAATWYRDADGDGHGASPSTTACDLPAGHAADASDCDDTNAGAHPDAAEAVGDAVDGDCDGAEQCYVDSDADGYRGADTVASADTDCADPGEAAATLPGDCDDTDPAVHGGSAETPADGVDADCDGGELCYADADDDGYRDATNATVASADLDCADAGEADADSLADDCDDTNPAIHPDAAEGNCADPVDYNCDGSAGSADADGDGFAACEECDDGRTAVHPDATEVCNDLDDDCDGNVDVGAQDAVRWYADADADGYTDPNASVVACDPPAGHAAATEDDCDDTERTVHPDATEVADDGVDQDCDGADLAEGDTADDSGAPAFGDDGAGCGCATGGDAGAAGVLALAALAFARRRRR